MFQRVSYNFIACSECGRGCWPGYEQAHLRWHEKVMSTPGADGTLKERVAWLNERRDLRVAKKAFRDMKHLLWNMGIGKL